MTLIAIRARSVFAGLLLPDASRIARCKCFEYSTVPDGQSSKASDFLEESHRDLESSCRHF
jgi:hypothetical protein